MELLQFSRYLTLLLPSIIIDTFTSPQLPNYDFSKQRARHQRKKHFYKPVDFQSLLLND
eukprot:UN06354